MTDVLLTALKSSSNWKHLCGRHVGGEKRAPRKWPWQRLCTHVCSSSLFITAADPFISFLAVRLIDLHLNQWWRELQNGWWKCRQEQFWRRWWWRYGCRGHVPSSVVCILIFYLFFFLEISLDMLARSTYDMFMFENFYFFNFSSIAWEQTEY